MAGGFADAGGDDFASALDNALPESSAQCKKPKWCEPLGLALMAERAGLYVRCPTPLISLLFFLPGELLCSSSQWSLYCGDLVQSLPTTAAGRALSAFPVGHLQLSLETLLDPNVEASAVSRSPCLMECAREWLCTGFSRVNLQQCRHLLRTL